MQTVLVKMAAVAAFLLVMLVVAPAAVAEEQGDSLMLRHDTMVQRPVGISKAARNFMKREQKRRSGQKGRRKQETQPSGGQSSKIPAQGSTVHSVLKVGMIYAWPQTLSVEVSGKLEHIDMGVKVGMTSDRFELDKLDPDSLVLATQVGFGAEAAQAAGSASFKPYITQVSSKDPPIAAVAGSSGPSVDSQGAGSKAQSGQPSGAVDSASQSGTLKSSSSSGASREPTSTSSSACAQKPAAGLEFPSDGTGAVGSGAGQDKASTATGGAATAAHSEHTLPAGASVGPSVPMSGASASASYQQSPGGAKDRQKIWSGFLELSHRVLSRALDTLASGNPAILNFWREEVQGDEGSVVSSDGSSTGSSPHKKPRQEDLAGDGSDGEDGDHDQQASGGAASKAGVPEAGYPLRMVMPPVDADQLISSLTRITKMSTLLVSMDHFFAAHVLVDAGQRAGSALAIPEPLDAGKVEESSKVALDSASDVLAKARTSDSLDVVQRFLSRFPDSDGETHSGPARSAEPSGSMAMASGPASGSGAAELDPSSGAKRPRTIAVRGGKVEHPAGQPMHYSHGAQTVEKIAHLNLQAFGLVKLGSLAGTTETFIPLVHVTSGMTTADLRSRITTAIDAVKDDAKVFAVLLDHDSFSKIMREVYAFKQKLAPGWRAGGIDRSKLNQDYIAHLRAALTEAMETCQWVALLDSLVDVGEIAIRLAELGVVVNMRPAEGQEWLKTFTPSKLQDFNEMDLTPAPDEDEIAIEAVTWAGPIHYAHHMLLLRDCPMN